MLPASISVILILDALTRGGIQPPTRGDEASCRTGSDGAPSAPSRTQSPELGTGDFPSASLQVRSCISLPPVSKILHPLLSPDPLPRPSLVDYILTTHPTWEISYMKNAPNTANSVTVQLTLLQHVRVTCIRLQVGQFIRTRDILQPRVESLVTLNSYIG